MSRGQQRAAGYVRVSTEDQAEGYSLDAQRREIARYCERHGFDLIRLYADEGVSGHTEKIERRPELVVLLEDAAHGVFDVVIVHTIDRWARNVGVQRQALQRLGEAGVGFASVTENIDFTTPAGKLMLTMIGGVSEFFSDQLAVHVSKGQRERAEKGLPSGPFRSATSHRCRGPRPFPIQTRAGRYASRSSAARPGLPTGRSRAGSTRKGSSRGARMRFLRRSRSRTCSRTASMQA